MPYGTTPSTVTWIHVKNVEQCDKKGFGSSVILVTRLVVLPFICFFLIQRKTKVMWGPIWGVWGLKHLWNVVFG
jgi:phosphomevalonate kinase